MRWTAILFTIFLIAHCSDLPGSRTNDGNCILGLQEFEPVFSYLAFVEIEKKGNQDFRNITFDVSHNARTLEAMEQNYCDLGVVDAAWLKQRPTDIKHTIHKIGYHCPTKSELILLLHKNAGEKSKETALKLQAPEITEKFLFYQIENSPDKCQTINESAIH